MKIHFLGGAQTVTGSQHLLNFNGHRILLECGLYQGRRADTYRRNQNFAFDPSRLDAVVLSHAHIDHSGNLPNLVKRGFRGPIYATHATVDLCQIMLRDSAYLHEKDVEWVNKKRRREQQELAEPLYTIEDAEAAMEHFVGVDYASEVEVASGVVMNFRDAGHILGSAGVILEFKADGRKVRLGFTGDLGRKDMPVIRDPDYLRDLDLLIMECTYGNRRHRLSEDVEEDLAALVRRVAERGGRIVVPSFAVGRTQLLVYILHKLFNQNRIPDLPIFVDSPLAVNATEVFRRHPECLDRETERVFLRNGEDPFGFGRLRYVRDVEESKKLNDLTYPHIVISASGMAEGGRILHHLRHSVGNPRNLVLLVGYAAPETLARKLMDGHRRVPIFGEEHEVRCEVLRIDDFSAHADRDELLEFLQIVPPGRLKQVFLVHGEPEQARPFQETLRNLGYAAVHYPAPGDVFEPA
ncbi:MAG: MBL fold metallo-hydrolase [Acidobacteriota bacterium]